VGGFVFIKYEGPDAGEVLVTMLSEEAPDGVVHELETVTERRVGFMPNPEPDDEPEDEPDEDTD
jgi:hypothetical protein